MRVLLVDDDPDIRLLVRSVLTRAGLRADAAPDARSGLKMLTAGRPAFDLVVLDVQMPEMDGWDTLEAIRSNPPTADIRVILCTVKSSPEDIAHAWRLGCDGYITKPFDLRDLASEALSVALRAEADRQKARALGLARANEALNAA